MKPTIKHTPGPWHAITREKYTLGGDSVEIVRLTRDGEWVEDHIADVGLCTGDDTEDDRAIWKEQEANARLIAAAPDLLEALKQVVAIADRKTDEFDRARTAIAIAEGKEVVNAFCSQFAGDGSRREAGHPSSIGLSVASPVASEGGKDWPVQCVHHVPIPADAEHPCPACKATQPTPPPVSNEFVAEGCEQFTSSQIDALKAVAREILKWENAAMIPGYRLIEIVEMARKALGLL